MHTSAALVKKWEDEALHEHHKRRSWKSLLRVEKKLGNLKYLNKLLEHGFQNVSDKKREKIKMACKGAGRASIGAERRIQASVKKIADTSENYRLQNETVKSGITDTDTADYESFDPTIEIKDLRKVMKDAGYKVNSDEEMQRVLDFVKELKAKEGKEPFMGEQPTPGDDKIWLTMYQVE